MIQKTEESWDIHGYPHLLLASISPDEMSNPKMSSTQLAPRDQVSTIELVKEDPVAMVDAKLQQNVPSGNLT